MASAFTHVLVAGAIARFSAPPRLRLALVLAVLSVLPDADVIAFRFGIPYEHPLGHRGFTHSIPFAFLCGVATPWLVAFPQHLRGRAWLLIAGLGFLATVSHGLLDALTNGGLGVGFFIPLSSMRYFLPWRPLEVSPLSAGEFLTPAGLRILESEILWVWLPVIALSGVASLARSRRDIA